EMATRCQFGLSMRGATKLIAKPKGSSPPAAAPPPKANQPKKASCDEILEVWLRLPQQEQPQFLKKFFRDVIGLKAAREILRRLEDEASLPIAQSDWRPSVEVH